MSLIEVTGLNHRYGERAILENINLSVDRGEVFALIGPTGAGKTVIAEHVITDCLAKEKINYNL